MGLLNFVCESYFFFCRSPWTYVFKILVNSCYSYPICILSLFLQDFKTSVKFNCTNHLFVRLIAYVITFKCHLISHQSFVAFYEPSIDYAKLSMQRVQECSKDFHEVLLKALLSCTSLAYLNEIFENRIVSKYYTTKLILIPISTIKLWS